MLIKDGIYDKSVTWGILKECKNNVQRFNKNLSEV